MYTTIAILRAVPDKKCVSLKQETNFKVLASGKLSTQKVIVRPPHGKGNVIKTGSKDQMNLLTK